jgi:aminocarboxymuconate-semialdehyde decarboxylase
VPGTDIHAHLAPQLDPVLLEELPGITPGPSGRLVLDGREPGPPKLYDTAALEQYLAEAELDHAVVSLPPPFYRQHLPAEEARLWVRAVNDGMLDRIEGRQGLRALAYLPLEHPDLALAEYERIRGDNRFVGVTAAAGGASVTASDPALEPLWKALDDDDAVLLLHPGSAPDPRLSDFYLVNLLGNPSETAVSVAHLVFSGVLTRFPRLRIVLVHCGGTLAAVVGRWQRGVDTNRPGIGDLPEPPREAVRRLYVDCLAHDPAVVDLAISTFGEDRLLLGSDWPFPMGIERPVQMIEHRGADIVRKVAVENPATLLGTLAPASQSLT